LVILFANNYGEISLLKEFCYLGSMIFDEARRHREIKRRIAMRKEAFSRKKELLRGGLKRCLSQEENGEYNTLIWSVTYKVRLLCRNMTSEKEDITKLEAFEMWIWRRMEKISWTERISNEEVLKLVEEERSL